MTVATTADAHATALGAAELQGLAAVVGLLARVGDVDSLVNGRPSEPRDNRIHVGYDEAAQRLNIPEKWLRERISLLPHRKFGKHVQFAEEDIRAISEMHFVGPSATDDKVNGPAIAPIRPSRSRKRS
ncbi:hypothetical protein [Streptomyces daliensis]|uniref:Helix-turn-helix domain-containing protein n=1 Tax=Streptomyces daliensis TaxID=299421 RepID=A0A8T4IWT2_9ACTN|nr:hypothetical protein [Streptomyces daliensis]